MFKILPVKNLKILCNAIDKDVNEKGSRICLKG